jgi:hypothetical protein
MLAGGLDPGQVSSDKRGGAAQRAMRTLGDRAVDVFLAGSPGRRFSENYGARVLRALQPRVVVASHFDDFFRPLGSPQGLSPRALCANRGAAQQ